MDAYIGTKVVLAEPMDQFTASQLGFLRGDVVVTVESDGTTPAGYKVVYEDGYTSWSPAATFERAYRRVTDAERALLRRQA